MEAEQKPPETKPARAERTERVERADRIERAEKADGPRGETAPAPAVRRRASAAALAAAAAASQTPTEPRETAPSSEPPREVIRFAPEPRLNVAYNPNCTHEARAREGFVSEVLAKSEAGGRAFCPRCDQQAMRFVRVNTALGLFGIGACERCGYWYLM